MISGAEDLMVYCGGSNTSSVDCITARRQPQHICLLFYTVEKLTLKTLQLDTLYREFLKYFLFLIDTLLAGIFDDYYYINTN